MAVKKKKAKKKPAKKKPAPKKATKKKVVKKATPKKASPKRAVKKAVRKTSKKKVGRPKRAFSPEQIANMCKYALAGCQNNTIASIMGVPMQTLVDNYRELLTKKRGERKYNIRKEQNKHMKTNPTMAIFLGKNELDQSDKQDIEHSGGVTVIIDR